MSESTTESPTAGFSPCASLAAIGIALQQRQLFAPICELVNIKQKTVKYTPAQKLYDAFITILAGAHGLVEVNKRLRADPVLQAAFGRDGCAEQSVVQETLDACTDENVKQMHQAMETIFRRHSGSYRHHYQRAWLLLDIDVTGKPCGPKAAFATKGYFPKTAHRRGRQLGRVVATDYQEVVADRLYHGGTQLPMCFQELVQAAEHTLETEGEAGLAKRRRTILRVDSGGGSVDDVNWALARGYQFHGKDYSGCRAETLAATVTEWLPDPKIPERQIGWVHSPISPYLRLVQRIAVRCRKKNGQWGYGVVLSTLRPREILELTHQPVAWARDPQSAAVLFAYVYFYDLRGGASETVNREDKQGLGITKRNKKRFPAQQVLVQLDALAHNVIVWTRGWLAPQAPRVMQLGVQRMVRDLFHVSGQVVFDDSGRVLHIMLNRADGLAHMALKGLRALLVQCHVRVNLGET